MRPDLDKITELVAKAKVVAESIPQGDDRRHLVPAINLSCDGIDLALTLLHSPLPFTESMRTQTTGRLNVFMEQLRYTLLQVKAWELAQEVGKAAKGRKKGGNETAAKLKLEAAARDAKLLAEAKKILKINPSMSVNAIASSLSERQGLGNVDVIRKKLARLLR